MKCCFTGKPHQVTVSFLVFGQHQQMVVLVSVSLGSMIVRLADIQLAPEDRLDPLLLRRVEEVHRPEDVAVVCHCHGLLPDLVDMRHQLVDVASPI